MDINKVEMYMMTNGKYFPDDKLVFIKDKLIEMDDSRFMTVSMLEMKDPMVYLLVSVFLGYLGIDRFLLGDVGMGILKLLTAGLCGILVIYDWVTIMQKAKENNFARLMQTV